MEYSSSSSSDYDKYMMLVLDVAVATSHAFFSADSDSSDTLCHHGGSLVGKSHNISRNFVAAFDTVSMH